MSRLQGGIWAGTAVNSITRHSEQVTVEIEVQDNGSLVGNFIQSQSPRSEQPSIHGQYSPVGALSFTYRVDKERHAIFTGRFDMTDEEQGTIWGSLILVYGPDRREAGTAALQFISKAGPLPTANGGVWGHG